MSWMKECVASARVSVLVNGSPTPEFCPQRGLRQRDPLSPFMFIIVAEALNILLARAKSLGLIRGAFVGSSGLRITHLQFADDTIMFYEADWREIINIKRILRFGAEDNSLWKDVICRKYMELAWNWFLSNERVSRMSKIWGDIVNTVATRAEFLQFFKSNVVVKIGDGRRTRFWTDCWLDGVCLKDEFPRLYSLSVDKVGSVFMFHNCRDKSGNWIFNFRRPFFAWKEEEMSRLIVHLSSSLVLSVNVANCLCWRADLSGIFSVSSVYNWFELGFGPTCMISRSLGKAFFGWLVWRGRIKTTSLLRRIGILNVNVDANFEVLCDTIKVRIALWVKSSDASLAYSVNDLVHNLQHFFVVNSGLTSISGVIIC
ncbi:uncharacterized protein LOC114264963 [Camellia sinensis]|uniref:uncharacterized protein LOC114264963 n=1 Tax=Camellia sinensis TaxID=4442 RepID=UPI0010363081|nr:uncharacterized protein LOC114264963 [Camellia sinensis]